jgi:uncharacterized protein (DUF2267 family)
VREDAFIVEVQRRGHLATTAETRHAVRAVLRCLAENMPDGWADQLAAALPPRIGAPLHHDRWKAAGGQPTSGTFISRLSGRAAVPPAQAAYLAQAVFAALRLACDAALLRRVCAGFTDEIWAVLQPQDTSHAGQYRTGTFALARVAMAKGA